MSHRRVVLLAAALLSSASFSASAATVRIKGSDTIGGALGPDLAERYHEENPATAIEWQAFGSSTAFPALFDGSADLGASSRPINESEQLEAKRLGIHLREWVIAYDGIVLVVHPSNPLPALTLDQASRIFQGKVRNFREVGGPDRTIELLARPSYSGTHAFFKEKVLRRGNAKGPEEFSESTVFVEHNAEIVERVATHPNAISFLGIGWVKPPLRAVPVAIGKSGPSRLASAETIRDGSYPIFRPLYLYSLGEPQGEVRNLIAYILSEAGQRQVVADGFVRTDVAPQLAYRAAADGSVSATAQAQVRDPRPAGAPTAPKPADSTPAAVTAPRVLRVYFGSGGARIGDEAELRIIEASRSLSPKSVHALIVGHADALGSKAANDGISAARAKAVYLELRRLGIPAERLAVSSRGAEEPIDTNDTLAGRQANRRVDILFVEASPRVGG
ncbi:MAG: phosphate ABC transporter substrate-binding/OmpA family protein [Thermoanaerobaculia bacterium]